MIQRRRRRRGAWLRDDRVVECLARYPPSEPEPQDEHRKPVPGQREFEWSNDPPDDSGELVPQSQPKTKRPTR